MSSHITGLDWLMIGLYFGILLCVAWWVIRKGRENAADYFLAGRNLGWWVIGASIFASNIGSEHIVGLAGSGATSGVRVDRYPEGVRAFGVPATRIAEQLGRKMVLNVVMVGFFGAVTNLLDPEALRNAVADSVPAAFQKLNLDAI